MEIRRFEDLLVWQKAKELSIKTYKLFKENKDWRFCNQIQSAAISISNNIAKGFERRTNNEFRNFLYISRGSCGEYRSMLYITFELEYLNKEKFTELGRDSIEISKMLYGLIKSLNYK